MSLNLITTETRLNNTATNPTTENSYVTVKEVNEVIEVVNDILAGTEPITEVIVSNGTAAAPSMTFSSDQDTGIYLASANNLGVSANGAQVLNVNATGLQVTGVINGSSTTDSTTKDTGAIITEGGIGVEKSIVTGLSITAGTTLKVNSTTDSTTKDTGSIITEGGLGVEKAIFAGTTINAGTDLSVGGGISLAKEVNHNIFVVASTTAATNGGRVSVFGGNGNTSGNGGAANLIGGNAGDTGIGGAAGISSGDGGATSGASGPINISTGISTIGASGTITISTGDTSSGVAGDIILRGGTGTSTTVTPCIQLQKAVVMKPADASVASAGTITGVELVNGHISGTGATGNWQLPSAADITTAIGSTPAGTNFEFIFNASGMTATNTATLVVGAGMTVMSAPAITGGGTLTVTQDTQVVGLFRVIFDTPTTCKISRIA